MYFLYHYSDLKSYIAYVKNDIYYRPISAVSIANVDI
jgi:hypothetical protein